MTNWSDRKFAPEQNRSEAERDVIKRTARGYLSRWADDVNPKYREDPSRLVHEDKEAKRESAMRIVHVLNALTDVEQWNNWPVDSSAQEGTQVIFPATNMMRDSAVVRLSTPHAFIKLLERYERTGAVPMSETLQKTKVATADYEADYDSEQYRGEALDLAASLGRVETLDGYQEWVSENRDALRKEVLSVQLHDQYMSLPLREWVNERALEVIRRDLSKISSSEEILSYREKMNAARFYPTFGPHGGPPTVLGTPSRKIRAYRERQIEPARKMANEILGEKLYRTFRRELEESNQATFSTLKSRIEDVLEGERGAERNRKVLKPIYIATLVQLTRHREKWLSEATK
ncbi:MAG: hypothetical protein RIQ56_698 [Candidatus Parcubacteria bacterium]